MDQMMKQPTIFLLPRSALVFLAGLFILIRSTPLLATDSTDLENPFYLPQTAIFVGNVDYNVEISNEIQKSNSRLQESGINIYGFDLEVNATSYMNIGALFRVEAASVNSFWQRQTITHQFATLVGGFTRFFYVPPFLKGRFFTTALFLRLELGVGPVIYNGPSGLIAQGGAHIGVETYINKWFGLSLSYGQSAEYGKETLINGSDDFVSYSPDLKNARFWSHGRVITFAIKTTFY